MKHKLGRRDFIKYGGAVGGVLLLGTRGGFSMSPDKSRVGFVRTEDRKQGVKTSIETLGINPVKNKDVLIKPNFNTADRVPGSTDNDTLAALVRQIWDMGAKSVTLGERSYPPTAKVMEQKQILPKLKDLDVRVLNFDDLDKKDWVKADAENSHWKDGFRVARPILEADCLVSTCCLKTHQFGGFFSMSLKLHVGVVPTTRHGFDYMTELHGSRHQRKMIAEINAAFQPDLIVMDGIETFVDGGPMTGKRADGNLFCASADRVAIDALGVAVLKYLGSNRNIMGTKIFEQDQIARAVTLGLGASSPSEIEIAAADDESKKYAEDIQKVLLEG